MQVVKRSFAALKHPKGSDERAALNLDWRTSEYMTSYRYGLTADDGTPTPFSYRTKGEALERAEQYAKTLYKPVGEL